jgi:folate-binding protein YgfZ
MSQLAPHLTPATGLSPALQLAALLQSAGIAPLDRAGWIRVTGEDRVRWLNGMVTNSIQQLTPGTGNYNFILSVQGRIQGDANIYSPPDPASIDLLVETAADRVSSLITLLDRFIIMDDVELTDISAHRTGLLLAGPQAPTLLQQLGIAAADLPELALQAVTWNDAEITIIRAHSPLVPKFELWAAPATIAALTQALTQALTPSGVVPCTPEAFDWLRILEGTPLYGTDIRDKELPQETTQTRALHFNKGCYLGQEIVERIRSRGNVHRTFAAFSLHGDLPNPGTHLEAESKQIGELTSVARIPLLSAPEPIQLALGYIRREAIERNLPLTYPGGAALPVNIPYNLAP